MKNMNKTGLRIAWGAVYGVLLFASAFVAARADGGILSCWFRAPVVYATAFMNGLFLIPIWWAGMFYLSALPKRRYLFVVGACLYFGMAIYWMGSFHAAQWGFNWRVMERNPPLFILLLGVYLLGQFFMFRMFWRSRNAT